jgi:hypothetical protein
MPMGYIAWRDGTYTRRLLFDREFHLALLFIFLGIGKLTITTNPNHHGV